jgi:hypothetical protein
LFSSGFSLLALPPQPNSTKANAETDKIRDAFIFSSFNRCKDKTIVACDRPFQKKRYLCNFKSINALIEKLKSY